ncbi:MAG: hypothetical protein JNK38_10430 [Acidobacteria bacterium]|nr:hypothetical protein [Acidobacteriota bacterium]
MKSRNRRRRRNSSPAAPVPTTPPLSLTAEIEQSIEARDKLEAAIPRFNQQREQAKPAFLRSLATSLQTAEISPNVIQERLTTLNAEQARAAEQYDALQQFQALFKVRVEAFKAASPLESASALQNIITRLSAERGNPGADQNAINARIKLLEDELKALQTKLPPAPPRDPKDKEREGPPQRKAETKSGRTKATRK